MLHINLKISAQKLHIPKNSALNSAMLFFKGTELLSIIHSSSDDQTP
jgi:hypothetical protein